MDERRAAARVAINPEIEATIAGATVRITELSAVGARIEHEERFALNTPQLLINWNGSTIALPIRVARSEIVGNKGGKLTYRTGIQFIGDRLTAEGVLSTILRGIDAAAVPPPVKSSTPPPPPVAPPAPAAAPAPRTPEKKSAPPPSFEDSWTRQVKFLPLEEDEDELPYAQYRHTGDRWTKVYVASPEQPEDGFTIPRDQRDFAELQRTFECADPDTRRMMQIALKSQLDSHGA